MTAGSPAERGFTLLELMVALALFAVLSSLAYGGLRQVMDTSESLAVEQAAFADLQRAFALLQQDVANLAPRPVRDALGDYLPALQAGIDGELLGLTRYIGAPLASGGPDLRRVHYTVEDDLLLRHVWPVLDRDQASSSRPLLLMENVQSLEVQFDNGQWQAFWPPAGSPAAAVVIPRAVRITITTGDGRSVGRTFLVAGGDA